jgi:uncharacterized alpha-E superfamily protein
MLARVAESLYWMARYCERAEDMARLINVNAHLVLDLPKGVAPGWERLIAITGSAEQYQSLYQDFSERHVMRFLIAQADAPSSILNAVNNARENARTIRDVIPREAWEHINGFSLWMREKAEKSLTVRTRFEFLNEVILRCQTLNGILSGSMNHDQGYLFFRLGRNLERADMTTRIIDVRSADLDHVRADPRHGQFDNLQWMSVLKSLTAYQMYRQSMNVSVRREEVLKFLFQSEVFPRAVMHCLRDLEDGIQTLPRNGAALASLARARQLVRTDAGALGTRELHEYIDQVQISLDAVAQALSDNYFWTGLATRHGALRSAA